MANQIPIVAILMIVQGVLECLMGLLIAIAGLFFPSMLDMMNQMMRQQPPPGGGPVPQFPDEMGWLITGIYVVLGTGTLIVGVLRIVAGTFNLNYRRRVLGIVALFFGVVTIFTCYCAPTSLGLMIYGLIVYFNEQSAQAFLLGAQGLSPADIKDRLARRSDMERRD